MKKVLVVVSFVLLAASCRGKVAVQTQTAPAPSPAPQAMSQQMSMKDLMMAGKSQRCDVDTSTATSQSKGTVYFSSGKMRGDFTTTLDGKAETTHMINDGTTVYTWVDGMATAMKMSVTAMDNMKAQANTPATAKPAVDPNTKYDYHCSAWSADEASFALPKGVTFTDFSAMMQTQVKTPSASAGASASGNAAACLACNNAGAGKAQCLAALKCK